jgi:His/Glu/Gln/Arg/opine family amino acid ABC transporter permease subunit
LSGLANTTVLSVLSATCALLLGVMLTPALMSRWRAIALPARVFVDGMRCVPFLLFAYIVYYGLPSLGLRLDNWSSGLAALIIYNTAYMAEILRGAWQAQPREPIEAGIGVRLSGSKAVPPHHPAATAADCRAGARQPDDTDHQGQRVPHHHRAAGADPCGKLDPVAPLCAVRRLHHGCAALLGGFA